MKEHSSKKNNVKISIIRVKNDKFLWSILLFFIFLEDEVMIQHSLNCYSVFWIFV